MENTQKKQTGYFSSHRFLFLVLTAACPFLLLALMSLFTAITGNSAITIGLDDEKLAVAAKDLAVSVEYNDISSMKSIAPFEIGKCISGQITQNTYEGTFFNADFGEYILLAYQGHGPYIYIEHSDGILITNCENADLTNYYYEQLSETLQD